MSTKKTYRTWSPTQAYLLPPSPMEWLPDGHLAYFILDVVGELDLSEISCAINEKDTRGNRPYDPEMMTSLLLYGYAVGVFSSRRIERATHEDVAFRVLAAGQHPYFTTIAAFRKQHLKALSSLFLQVLRMCQEAGLVKLGHVALAGTKVQGNASKHKAMSYERMLKKELQLEKEIAALLARAAETDASEDARFGEGQREEDLPEEFHRREARLAKIRVAKVRLEAEAKQARARHLREQAQRARQRAEGHPDPTERKRAATIAKTRAAKAEELAPGTDDDDLDPPTTSDGLDQHEPRPQTDGRPHPSAQMNFTDPDSRIMESGGSFLQGFNCQAAVDEQHQIIVGQSLSNLASDNANLIPMLKLVEAGCGAVPTTTTADAGYWKPTVLEACDGIGTDAYVSTRRRKHGAKDEDPEPTRSGEEPTSLERMRAKLQTEDGKKRYARRKAVVEPVFGQIKEARGFRRFFLRGLESAQAEWAMVCTTHSILKLYRFSGCYGAGSMRASRTGYLMAQG